jgi:hypothetical protein
MPCKSDRELQDLIQLPVADGLHATAGEPEIKRACLIKELGRLFVVVLTM